MLLESTRNSAIAFNIGSSIINSSGNTTLPCGQKIMTIPYI